MAERVPFLNTAYRAYDHRARPEEDVELTHVGPGTPCGEYLRRFWQPIITTEELSASTVLHHRASMGARPPSSVDSPRPNGETMKASSNRWRIIRGIVVAAVVACFGLGITGTASAQAAARPSDCAGRGVPVSKISIQLWTFAEYVGFGTDPATIARLEEVLSRLSDMGYRNVEPFTLSGLSAEDYRALLDKYGLNASARHVNVGTPEDPADIEAILEENRILGIKYFGSGSTPIFPLVYTTEAQWIAYAEYLNEVGEQARRAGQTLMVHNHDIEFEVMFGDQTVFDILAAYTDPTLDVLAGQSYIAKAEVLEDYVLEHTLWGAQPWQMALPADAYDAVYHLGFREYPDRHCIAYTAHQVSLPEPDPDSFAIEVPHTGIVERRGLRAPYVVITGLSATGSGSQTWSWSNDKVSDFVESCGYPAYFAGLDDERERLPVSRQACIPPWAHDARDRRSDAGRQSRRHVFNRHGRSGVRRLAWDGRAAGVPLRR